MQLCHVAGKKRTFREDGIVAASDGAKQFGLYFVAHGGVMVTSSNSAASSHRFAKDNTASPENS